MKEIENIGQTGISLNYLSEIVAKRIFGIYLLDVEHNNIIPLKTSRDSEINCDNEVLNWDTELTDIINHFVSTKYRAMALILYSRECVRKKLSSTEMVSEFVFERTNGDWNNLSLQPVKVENGECKIALATIVDITAVKKRTETVEKQMELVKHDMKTLNDFVLQAINNNYTQIMKVDLVSGDTYKLTVDNGNVSERPMTNWNDIYESIFDNIYPSDYERARSVLARHKIKEMQPGTNVSSIYRAKMISKDYHWYKTIVTVLEDEPTTALICTVDETETINQVKPILLSDN